MWHLYLDESGDLGFNFEQKRPSDHLTICILALHGRRAVLSVRRAVKKTLARKVNRRRVHKQELKGTATHIGIKRYFYDQLRRVDLQVFAVTLRKRDVQRYLADGAITKPGVYDLVADHLLRHLPLDAAADGVELIVDRSKNRREIADFNRAIGRHLASRVPQGAPVRIDHVRSWADHGLSAADLFCWGIFRRYEAGDSQWYEVYRERIAVDVVYPQ